jgi:hypothetical protein
MPRRGYSRKPKIAVYNSTSAQIASMSQHPWLVHFYAMVDQSAQLWVNPMRYRAPRFGRTMSMMVGLCE